MNKIILVLVFFFSLVFSFFTVSSFAQAASFHYTCADMTNDGSPTPSCTSDVFTLAGGTSGIYDAPPNFLLSNNTTYYLSVVYSGSGTARFRASGDLNDGSFVSLGSSLVDEPFVTPSTNNLAFLYIQSNGSFSGQLSELCVTDTPGECLAQPPSSATSTLILDPNRDYFYGLFLFLVMFFGMIWLFAKPR